LDISDCLFTGNQAIGGVGVEKAKGGDGLGGALYILGTATFIDSTITGNQGQGGAARPATLSPTPPVQQAIVPETHAA
jgi:hypothetical protein